MKKIDEEGVSEENVISINSRKRSKENNNRSLNSSQNVKNNSISLRLGSRSASLTKERIRDLNLFNDNDLIKGITNTVTEESPVEGQESLTETKEPGINSDSEEKSSKFTVLDKNQRYSYRADKTSIGTRGLDSQALFTAGNQSNDFFLRSSPCWENSKEEKSNKSSHKKKTFQNFKGLSFREENNPKKKKKRKQKLSGRSSKGNNKYDNNHIQNLIQNYRKKKRLRGAEAESEPLNVKNWPKKEKGIKGKNSYCLSSSNIKPSYHMNLKKNCAGKTHRRTYSDTYSIKNIKQFKTVNGHISSARNQRSNKQSSFLHLSYVKDLGFHSPRSKVNSFRKSSDAKKNFFKGSANIQDSFLSLLKKNGEMETMLRSKDLKIKKLEIEKTKLSEKIKLLSGKNEDFKEVR